MILTRSKIAQGIFNIIILFFILGIIAEAYFRFFYAATDDIGITLSGRRWKEKYCKYNSQGFRDEREFTGLKPGGVLRIGILGDSYVFGQGIKADARLSNLLEKLFTSNLGVNCQVYNFGKCGWNTLDERNYFFNKGLTYSLDALVLCSLELDDFLETLGIDTDEICYTDKAHIPNKSVVFLLNNSYAFSFFYAQYYKMHCMFSMLKGGFSEKVNALISKEENWDKYFGYIKEIEAECKKRGVAFYVVSFPVIGWGSDKGSRLIIERFEGFLKSYLDMHKIKYILLNDYLRKYNYKDLIVSIFDFHPNALVNRIAAEQLFNLMQHLKQ